MAAIASVPWPCWVIWGFVAWAFLGTFRRPASGVLAILWMVAEVYSRATGDSAPVEVYLATDFLLLGPILLFAEGCWTDRVIASILVAQFKCYLELPHYSREQWWSLWVLTIIQMALAGPWPQVVEWARRRYAGGLQRTSGVS